MSHKPVIACAVAGNESLATGAFLPMRKLLPATAMARPPFLSRSLSDLRLSWLCPLLFFAVAFVIHGPSLSGDFLWDDTYLAHDNPFIRSPLFVFEVFRHHLFLDSLSPHYRPVQNLSFIVDYLFWNDDPYGFHLTNVGLHALSGTLLYFLLLRLLRPLSSAQGSALLNSHAAFLVALLWMVHPVQSAAVDYISGRADSLAFCFACAGWLLMFKASQARRVSVRIVLYGLAAALGLLSFCSRETGGLWLLIFLLHTIAFSKAWNRRGKVAICLGCVVLCATYCGLRLLPERRSGPSLQPGWSAPVRVVLMFRALGDYGRLMIYPANLHMERTVVNAENYESQSAWEKSVSLEYLSVGGLVLIGLLAGACLWKSPCRKARIFGALWFTVGFLPVSNLFPLNATVAEHWLYLPSVGLLIFLAGVALDLPAHFRRVVAVGAVVGVLALSVRSFYRSSDWTTAEHFYEQTIASGGTSVRVSLNLGQIYATRGEYARAERLFREILHDYPDYAPAQTNLANALFREGKTKEAEAAFAAASTAAPRERAEYPHTWLGAVNLAGIKRNRKDFQGALATLGAAQADYPRVWEIVALQSEILRETAGPAAAIPVVEKYRRANWWNYEASLALGRLQAQEGNLGEAASDLRNASRLDVHEVEALGLLAELALKQNRLAEACALQQRAVARQPNLPRGYVSLSRILEKMGRIAEARAALDNVARLETAALEFGPVALN